MNNNQIIDLFYNELVEEVNKNQTIKIGDSIFQFPFFIKTNELIDIPEEGLPVLQIKDKETFDSLLTEYIYKHEYFINENEDLKELLPACCGSTNRKEIIKYLLAVLWQNATEEDFKDPILYLKNRNEFLDSYNRLENVEMTAILDDEKEYYISSRICKQLPSLETPYYLKSTIYHYNEEGKFETYSLPRISFGICDNKAYVYSIQTKNHQKIDLTSFEKKINRYLYKANEDVLESEEFLEYKNQISSYYPENISDITVNSLYSLVMLFELFKRLDINEVECITYLPLRYLAKKRSNESKNDILNNLYINLGFMEEVKKDTVDFEQQNITDKFVRTFNRYCYHFEEATITSYPFEQSSNLKISINDNKTDSNHILNKVANSVEIKYNEKSR